MGAIVSDTSSQSFGCKGKEAEEDLQALTAQVRKLSVRTFMIAGVEGKRVGGGGFNRRVRGGGDLLWSGQIWAGTFSDKKPRDLFKIRLDLGDKTATITCDATPED